MRILTVTLCALLAALACQAQNPKIKYGKITPQELDKKVYSIDSNANAIILSDVGETKIVGNNKGSFSLVFKRHKRIHILNKNGYDEANVQIPLYTNGSSTEELDNLKAVTYNLEAGKIVETKLEKAGVFSETRSRNLVIKKFTFPNVKEGSVIEYTYLIQSDFLSNLQPWTFQDRNPVLWSEYNVSIPEFLNYVFLSQGTLSFFEKSRKDHSEEYRVSNSARSIEAERGSISASVADYHWAMKDVPELKEENFTSSLENYKAKIDFQLTAIQRPLEYQNLLGSWQEISKKLLEDEDFGRNLSTSNAWMGDVVKPLLAGATSDKEKAQRIFAFIRDNITCTSHYGFYTSQPLKNILKNKNGRVSDVNLLLTAMLRYAEIKADPVILSTKENGFTYPIYPLLSRFNYLVAQVTTDGGTYMLDASHPRLGFGKLPYNCYNGHAQVVNNEAPGLEMTADSLKERKLTTVFISNDEKGTWGGRIKHMPGYYESYSIRQKINETGKETYLKELKKDFGMAMNIQNQTIDSLTQLDLPIAISYDFDLNIEKEDLVYMSPMLSEGYKENPFKSAQRSYPVEMPYCFDNTYVATIAIPNGYELDEMPKPIKIKFNEEGEGYFEYLITKSNNVISMRSVVKMQRTMFEPEEYENLREFFNIIVSKQKEQIVFKKKI